MNQIYNQWLLDFQHEQMSDYLAEFERALKNFESKIANVFIAGERHQQIVNDGKAEQQTDTQAEFIDRIMGDIPRRMYSNFVVNWVSFVEDYLVQLCRDIYPQETEEIVEQDGFRNGIRSARKILKLTTHNNIPQEYWQELELVSELINIICNQEGKLLYSMDKHENGVAVSVQNDEIIYCLQADGDLDQYLRRHSIVQLDGAFFISPTGDFCRYLIDFYKEFFERLFEDLGLGS